MQTFVDTLNGYVWSPALILFCLATGVYFSLRTRFLQVRHAVHMIRLLREDCPSKTGVSAWQAFSLAISGRVGTGNIAGVATAIGMGGPGAVFWMWLIAFVGAGSAFVEATLAQIYKEEAGGQYRGGPAYYIERGLKMKGYAVAFALLTVLATGVFLPGVQAHSIAEAVENAFHLPRYVTALLVSGLLGIIIFGGVRRIAQAATWFVPIMAGGYLLVALGIIVAHAGEVPAMLALIFRSAFGADAAYGAIVGQAVAWGVKRGVYSNEAGQGTAPMAAAAAETRHPAAQGLVQAFSVYVDTWLVCSATALMILLTGAYNVSAPDGGFLVQNLPGVGHGVGYTQAAVDSMLPGFGAVFVAVSLFLFAFTTLMAYYYYAETNLAYLRRNVTSPRLTLALRSLFLAVVFLGTLRSAELAWGLGDIGVGAMAWLNLVAILLLSRPALACLRDYEAQLAQKKTPVFVSSEQGITNTALWRKE